MKLDLSAEQIQLASLIDVHVQQFPLSDDGDAQLLTSIADYMDAFKRILDSSTKVQMDYLGLQYEGFYRMAKLLEALAEARAAGDIQVPEDH